MTDKNKVRVDPQGRALRFLDEAQRQQREEAERRQKEEMERQQREAEQKRRQERAMKRGEEKKNAARTHALITQPKFEVLPPASKTPALTAPNATAVPGLDLAEFERQIKNSAKMLNLTEPEGFLDRLFDRPDHRIEVKTERGRRLAAYIAACTAIIKEAGTLQDARRQPHLDHLVFLRRMAEEQNNLEAVTTRSRLQGQIEEAKARAEIARYEADAREAGLRGRPAPPPLPPPPAPPAPKPEDPRAKKKASLKQDLDRLDKEEKEDLAKIYGGKPQGEWTDAMHEDVKRTINMYYQAKEKIREELENYL